MDEIVVAQNKYISSKRASRLTGYAQDYIGQLVRLGKVNATKVGKSWFVDEGALMRHINGSSRLAGPVRELAAMETKAQSGYVSSVTAGITYPSTWKAITYLTDDSPLQPISDSRDIPIVKSSSNNFFADNAVTRGISVIASRRSDPVKRVVVANSIDGVRFEAPRVNAKADFSQNSVPRASFSVSLGSDEQFVAINATQLAESLGSRVLKVLASGLVAALVVFFVPLVV